jgi:hypothetical protein
MLKHRVLLKHRFSYKFPPLCEREGLGRASINHKANWFLKELEEKYQVGVTFRTDRREKRALSMPKSRCVTLSFRIFVSRKTFIQMLAVDYFEKSKSLHAIELIYVLIQCTSVTLQAILIKKLAAVARACLLNVLCSRHLEYVPQ